MLPTHRSPEEAPRELIVLADSTLGLAHWLDEGMVFEGYHCP